MAVKKITMKNKNGAIWDELYPKTTPDQVLTDANNRFVTDAQTASWNLKQSALGYSPINKAGDIMTGALTLNADPTNPMHAVTKQYADAIMSGVTSRTEVLAATTGNTSLAGTQTIDGVAVGVGAKVLVKDQTAPAENGIYIVASGAWVRSIDYCTISSLSSAFVFVQQGALNADKGWVCTVDDTAVLGTSPIVWTQFSGPGSVSMVAGSGVDVSQSGNQFTITHKDTSNQVSSSNTGATVIQSVGLDGMGHVTSLNTKSLAPSDISAVPTSDVVTSPTANKILKLDGNSKLPGNITGNADGNAGTATKLQTARTITISGDVDGSVSTDLSANPTINVSLDTIVTANANTMISYDAKGRVTSSRRALPSEVGVTVSVTASPPASPVDGDLWYEVTG